MADLGGPEGNTRLTSTTAVLLVGLLALEGVTILFIRPLISMHVFVGLMLIPPVGLKLASTGWRFFRYYTGSRPYVLRGPPNILLRAVVAPVVVASTLVVFGTGISMLFVHPRNGTLVGLHKVGFVVWLASTGVHVLAHLSRVARAAPADLRPATRLPAGPLRIGLVGVSLAAGAVVAAAAFHLATPWLDWVRVH
jgi:hypothetical protein